MSRVAGQRVMKTFSCLSPNTMKTTVPTNYTKIIIFQQNMRVAKMEVLDQAALTICFRFVHKSKIYKHSSFQEVLVKRRITLISFIPEAIKDGFLAKKKNQNFCQRHVGPEFFVLCCKSSDLNNFTQTLLDQIKSTSKQLQFITNSFLNTNIKKNNNFNKFEMPS